MTLVSLTLISTPEVHVDPRHTFCEIFYDLFVIFLPYFRYSLPRHIIMPTKYHLLGHGPKTYVFNFALGSAWTPNPSIMKHNADMGEIA